MLTCPCPDVRGCDAPKGFYPCSWDCREMRETDCRETREKRETDCRETRVTPAETQIYFRWTNLEDRN